MSRGRSGRAVFMTVISEGEEDCWEEEQSRLAHSSITKLELQEREKKRERERERDYDDSAAQGR